MAQAYQWLAFSTARQQLAARLADPSNLFWADAENGIYIVEALRTFNALTAMWKQDFAFSPVQIWTRVDGVANSPRARTVTDAQVYAQIQYHLLEPPTGGGTWTGTGMFTLADLSGALQRRRDEAIQVSNCNGSLLTGIASSPNTRRVPLPDTVIEVQRVRYIPTTGFNVGPVTLFREDALSLEYFEYGSNQQTGALPLSYSQSADPPLSFDVDVAPTVPGTYEAIVLQSGAAFNPPAVTLLGIPDDFAWVAKWGALADLLGRESEATDAQRAAHCRKRYADGLKALSGTPWIMLAKIAGIPVDVPAFTDEDAYNPGWDQGSFNEIPLAGTDLLAAPVGAGVALTLLGNAPIPVNDGDFVQVSRGNWDAVLDYAQFLAAFKQGGQEFTEALQLEARFLKFCAAENSRLRELGIFSDVLLSQAENELVAQPRYGRG